MIDASLCSAQLEYLGHLRRRVRELELESTDNEQLNTSIGSCTDILGSDLQ